MAATICFTYQVRNKFAWLRTHAKIHPGVLVNGGAIVRADKLGKQRLIPRMSSTISRTASPKPKKKPKFSGMDSYTHEDSIHRVSTSPSQDRHCFVFVQDFINLQIGLGNLLN